MNPPFFARATTLVPRVRAEIPLPPPETADVEAAEELRIVAVAHRAARVDDDARARAAAADAAARHGRDTRLKLPDIDETRNTARRGCGCTRHKARQKENPDIFVFGVVSSRRCPLVMRSD
jgi:hypothetical protein|tara:strand:- start:708 stop:1070 length:363 start_codon:yes stop_codon:yes gene_type:complete